MSSDLSENEKKEILEALHKTPPIYKRLQERYETQKENDKREARAWADSLSIAERWKSLEKFTIACDALIDSLKAQETTHAQRLERQQLGDLNR